MKIGLVSPYDYPYPGGVTKHITHLGENFVQLGHDVRIIAPSSGDPTQLAGQGVLVVGKPVGVPASGSVARISMSLRLSGRVKEILRREQFDIVHLHEPLMPTLPITVLRFSDTINVGTFHAYNASSYSRSTMGYYYGKRLLKRWFRKLHGKIAVSKPAMEFVSQYFPGYYNIIPNGIDFPRFSAPVPPIERWQDGKLNILFVGRLESRKGLKYLLRAFAYVKRQMPEVRLLVVGPDDGRRAGYARTLDRQGLADVEFVGFVDEGELVRYYHTADVFCAPNTGQESFGMILLEAMAAGKPIVASNIEGFAQVMTHREEGFLVGPKNEEALAMALINLLADPALRERMGEAGRLTARQYGWERVSQRVLSYYERLLSEFEPRHSPTLQPRIRPAEG
jgi:phosphatidylinositol alpha-mannosyltransferase